MVRGREADSPEALPLAPTEELAETVWAEAQPEEIQEEPIPDGVVLRYVGPSPRHVHCGVREYVWTPGSARAVYPQDAAYLLRFFRTKFVRVEA